MFDFIGYNLDRLILGVVINQFIMMMVFKDREDNNYMQNKNYNFENVQVYDKYMRL